jgi:hypothetical protein
MIAVDVGVSSAKQRKHYAVQCRDRHPGHVIYVGYYQMHVSVLMHAYRFVEGSSSLPRR